jgi:hypothetical protein
MAQKLSDDSSKYLFSKYSDCKCEDKTDCEIKCIACGESFCEDCDCDNVVTCEICGDCVCYICEEKGHAMHNESYHSED